MPTVTGYTAARMKEIEDQAIVDARLTSYNLVLVRHNLEEINVGNIRGEQGPRGLPGVDAVNELIWKTGAQLVGTAATGGGDAQPLRLVASSTVVTTNTAGDATITFPQAFSGGLSSVVAQVANNTSLPVDVSYTHVDGADYPNSTTGIGNVNLVAYDFQLNNFKVRTYISGGRDQVSFGQPYQDAALGGCNVRINYMAFGW
jgi:hypothetical protein